ncbi:hypothetical protein L3V66_12675, partial [Secundilactobacillus sp. HBUAS58055]|nr:hypothetical protein [Secundilactobacillus angelensis]
QHVITKGLDKADISFSPAIVNDFMIINHSTMRTGFWPIGQFAVNLDNPISPFSTTFNFYMFIIYA